LLFNRFDFRPVDARSGSINRFGYAEFIRARWPRLFTMAPHDDTDGRRHDLALELKLLVALSICTLV
jgi:hypothetical protein